MTPAQRFVASCSIVVLISACSQDPAPPEEAEASAAETPAAEAPSVAELADRLLDAMGGREALEGVDTLVREGGGTRTRMGQIPETGGTDPTGELTDVTETLDLANGRAALDYGVTSGGFMQHRTEVFTTFQGERIGWGTTEGRPEIVTTPNGLFSWATQNSPQMVLRRNVVTVALAAADTASETQTAEEREFQGETSLHGTAALPSGEEVALFFDPETGLLDGFETLDTESMLGDVEARYVLDDYRPVDGLTLPHAVTILKQERPYSSIEYTSIAVDPAGALDIFEIPEEVVDQAEQVVAAEGSWVPLTWNEVADGIYHAVAFSHHSMVVEFPGFVAVVEGPYTEAQGLTLARRVEEEIGKPIRYVVPTHPHYDHTGAIRALAAVGATVVVAEGHQAELRGIVESPHTNPPDELARRREAGEPVGDVEPFSGMRVIEEGDRRLELHEVQGIPHVQPKTLAYVPGPGVLFQSDLFFGAASPDAEALHAAIGELGLEVETLVGGHGGTLPYSALADAVTGN